MPTGTASLTINLGDEHSKPFKSIDRVTWSDIPEFAVLTGPNGSGKTQLLQAIAYKLTNVSHPQYKAELDNMPMTTTIGIEPHEVAYLPSSESSFRLQGATISNIVNAKYQFLGQLTPQHTQHDIDKQILREMVARRFGIRVEHQQHITEDHLNRLPNDFLFMLEYSDVSAGLAHVFYGYQVRRAEQLLAGRTEDDIVKDLGSPPWKFVNEALIAAEFNYQILPPDNKLLKDYVLRVASSGSEVPIDLNDLSSGERLF